MNCTMNLHYNEETKVIHNKSIQLPKYNSLGKLYYDSILKWKLDNLTAFVDGTTEESISYGDLLTKCVRTSMKLQQLGVQPKDIVSICSHNHLNLFISYISIQFVGAILSATDPTLSYNEQLQLINQIKPKLLFTNEESYDMLAKIIEELKLETILVVFGNAKNNGLCFNDFLHEQIGEDQFKPLDCSNSKETATIVFSSGSTGLPKGICLNHKFFMQNAINLFNLSSLKYKSMSSFTSLFWISTNMYFATSIIHGLKYIVFKEWKLENYWSDIEKYKIEFSFLSSYYAKLSATVLPKNGTSLKVMFVGGSPVSSVHLKSLRDSLNTTDVVIGYGQTEIGVTHFSVKDYYDNTNTVGVPVPGIYAKVVDIDTNEPVSFNQSGEICFKSDWFLNEYYKVECNHIFDSDGYLKSGDIGHYDENFNFYLTERIKDAFKYKSWQIYPLIIETVLESHPSVTRAAVIGVPHTLDDNHAMGFVILKQNTIITAEELVKYVEDRVEIKHRLLGGVKIVDSFPLTVSGKVKRIALKELII